MTFTWIENRGIYLYSLAFKTQELPCNKGEAWNKSLGHLTHIQSTFAPLCNGNTPHIKLEFDICELSGQLSVILDMCSDAGK